MSKTHLYILQLLSLFAIYIQVPLGTMGIGKAICLALAVIAYGTFSQMLGVERYIEANRSEADSDKS